MADATASVAVTSGKRRMRVRHCKGSIGLHSDMFADGPSIIPSRLLGSSCGDAESNFHGC